MDKRVDSGISSGEPISLQARRGHNLGHKIASARARRNEQPLSREDFMDEPMSEIAEAADPTHQAFREELRQIIAEDAERAANEPLEPSAEVMASLAPTPRQSRFKTALYWLGCVIGIGTVAYGLTRAS